MAVSARRMASKRTTGLTWEGSIMGEDAHRDRVARADAPVVRVADYPQLRSIAWSLRVDAEISELDALSLYERNWRHVGDLDDRESDFVRHLAEQYSGGRLLV